MGTAFDPGNGKVYKNIKEHITKKTDKGLEPMTKKLIQDMQSKKPKTTGK